MRLYVVQWFTCVQRVQTVVEPCHVASDGDNKMLEKNCLTYFVEAYVQCYTEVSPDLAFSSAKNAISHLIMITPHHNHFMALFPGPPG